MAWLKISNIKGPPGSRGPSGMAGPAGQSIIGPRGKDGSDGKDAPTIVDIDIEQQKNYFNFVIYLSDGSKYTTKEIKIPNGGTAYSFIGLGGGGGSGTGADGKSAYEIWIEEGNVGTPQDFLDSLVGADGVDGADGSQYYFGVGIPSNLIHSDNDIYQDVTNGDQYKKIAGAWVYQGTVGAGGGPSSTTEIIYDVPCESDVYPGAAVYIKKGPEVTSMMADWTNLFALTTMDSTVYQSVAANGLADDYDTSNIIGIVESKTSSILCNIRISGVSAANYYALNVYEEYYLSDFSPGAIVPTAAAPTSTGHILLKIGQPTGYSKLLYLRGERIVRA